MAPFPQETSSPIPQSSALPGMKRGIAIGLAISITLILIALLAHFAYRRRRNLRDEALRADLEASSATTWPNEKFGTQGDYWHHPELLAVEADARTIHELDGVGPVPELPTQVHVQELDAEGQQKRIRAQTGTGLSDWAKWTAALNRISIPPPSPPPPPNPTKSTKSLSRPRRRSIERPSTSMSAKSSQRPELSLLNISQAELTPLRNANISPLGTTRTSIGSSPLSVSPLEEAYLPQTPRTTRDWV